MICVLEALKQARQQLIEAGVENALLDADLLLAHIIGWPRERLYLHPQQPLQTVVMTSFNAALARRCAREPLSHIIGHREFWSLDFAVSSDVLDPRPDSETLVEAALAWASKQADTALHILDLGTGSGALLLSLLHQLPKAQGIGLDHSKAALAVAQGNALHLGLDKRANWIQGKWSAATKTAPFDLIISNPPYIPTSEIDGLAPEVRDYEPHLALDGGADGMDAYRQIIPLLRQLSHDRSAIFLEVGAQQAAPVAAMLLDQFSIQANCHQDLAGRDRVVSISLESLSAH